MINSQKIAIGVLLIVSILFISTVSAVYHSSIEHNPSIEYSAKNNPNHNLPIWLKMLKHSKIEPNSQIGKIKLGLKKEKLINLIGEPDNYMKHENSAYNSIGYEYNNIGFELIINKKTKKIQRIYLMDWDFNSLGILPATRGITIGSSRQELIKAFGKFSKARSLNNVCTIMSKKRPDGKAYLYGGIRFWMCNCNDQIYGITLP